jgi:hypothetical protein
MSRDFEKRRLRVPSTSSERVLTQRACLSKSASATQTPMRRLAWMGAVVPVVAIAVGCARHGEKVPSAPVRVPYAVDFPSAAAAIAADTVLLYVFPSTDESDCLTLADARTHGKDLPAASQQTSAPVCALHSQNANADISVSFGDVAILAVAQRNQKDFLIGCTIEHIDVNVETLSVPLTFIDNKQSVPDTTCATLSDHCANRCPPGG